MNSKEIEIKFELKEEEYKKIMKFLQQKGRFIQEQHQVDEYYSPVGKSFYDSGDRCLRIRIEGEKSILSYKQIHNENTTQQYIEEYETLIEDSQMVGRILKAIDFVQEIVIDKYRTEYMLKDNIIVAMDCVKDLGYFIEVENHDESEALEVRNACMVEMIRELRVDSAKRNNEGYSNMMFRKKKEKRSEIKN